MAKGDSECSSHNLTPHLAGTERVPLGLRQTGGAAISAIIPASRTIARGWGSWRTPSQPSRSTQWKSGTHGGTRARGSWRVASGRTAQLWTIVKGGGEGGGEEGGVRELFLKDKHDQPSSCLVTMLLLNQLSTSDPRSGTHHQQACFEIKPTTGWSKR